MFARGGGITVAANIIIKASLNAGFHMKLRSRSCKCAIKQLFLGVHIIQYSLSVSRNLRSTLKNETFLLDINLETQLREVNQRNFFETSNPVFSFLTK